MNKCEERSVTFQNDSAAGNEKVLLYFQPFFLPVGQKWTVVGEGQRRCCR